MAGLVGLPTCVAYGAAKGGVRIMSKSVAVELAEHDIRCNSVHPGFIWTNMQAQSAGASAPGGGAMPRDRVPLGRMGDPQDIANCVLYLASDACQFVHGHTLNVDGGFNAAGLMFPMTEMKSYKSGGRE